MFDSLKSRILLLVTCIVLFTTLPVMYFVQKETEKAVSTEADEHAQNLVNTVLLNVENEYKSLLFHKESLLERRKSELKNIVAIAIGRIDENYQKYADGVLSENEARRRAMEELRGMRYDEGVGYIWINDMETPLPRLVMHPVLPELEGRLLDKLEYYTALGLNKHLLQAFVDVCLEHGEGYVDYLWPKPTGEGVTVNQPKFSYVRLFEEWGWVVGTGVYVDDIEADARKRLAAILVELEEMLSKVKVAESGYMFMFNGKKEMLIHPLLKGKILERQINLIVDDLMAMAKKREGPLEYLWKKPSDQGDDLGFPKKAYVAYFEPLDWYICSSVYMDEIERPAKILRRKIAGLSVFFLILAFVLALLLSRNLTLPVRKLIEAARGIEERGTSSAHIPVGGTRETKALGQVLDKMVTSVNATTEALRESEKRYEIVAEQSHQLIYDYNEVSGEIRWAGAVFPVTGCTPEEFGSVTMEEWSGLVHPDDREEFVDRLRKACKTGGRYKAEYRFRKKTGDYLYIEDEGMVLPFSEENPCRLLGTMKDITERKRVEKEHLGHLAFLESLERIDRVMRGAVDHRQMMKKVLDEVASIFSCDATGLLYPCDPDVSSWDVPVESIRPDCLGITQILKETGMIPEFRDVIRRVLNSDEPVRYDSRSPNALSPEVRDRFEIRSLLVMGVYPKRGKPWMFGIRQCSHARVWTVEEERLFKEIGRRIGDSLNSLLLLDELIRTGNYLDNILDSMPSIVVGVDPQGRVTHWNLEAEKKTGRAAVDVMGHSLADVLPRMMGGMKKIMEAVKGGRFQKIEKVVMEVAGEQRFSEVTVSPLVTSGEGGAVVRIDDVTERIRMQEAMIQSEKMLSVGGLAAGMAHEINNPLAGILQNVQVLRDRMSCGLKKNIHVARECGTTMEAIERYMEKRGLFGVAQNIIESGYRAAKIVDNMLSFSRKSEAVKNGENICEVLDRTVELAGSDYDLKKKYDFRQIRIKREYESNVPPVCCERTKIQQVFFNILRNGAQAMNEKVASGQADYGPCFVLRVKKEGENVQVEIEDNGPGMDELSRKRAFEPFFTTKGVGLGTGLGLYVSYFIITEIHQGSMAVESIPGKGTNFVIRLPFEEDKGPGSK